MDAEGLQYIHDDSGARTAVILPIEQWNELAEERRQEITAGVKRGYLEVQDIIAGRKKKEAQTIQEFIDGL